MKRSGSMILNLSDELEKFVQDQVRSGASVSGSEYIGDLVRERYLRERDRADKIKVLDDALARGLADADAGRVLSAEEAFNELRLRLDLPLPSSGA